MARTVRDTNLDTRTARSKLKPRGKPYFRNLEPGLHLGYRRLSGGAGTWVCRLYAGCGVYSAQSIGTADDFSDSDGVAILSFSEAQKLARKRMVESAHSIAGVTGPLLVRNSLENYIEYLAAERKSARLARYVADAFILPQFAKREIASLTTDEFEQWRSDLVSTSARIRTKNGEAQRYRDHDNLEQRDRRRKSTANRIWTIFRAALNRSWEQGKVTSDSAWKRVKPFRNVDAARIRYLTIEESTRFLNACDTDFRILSRGALETGARYGELIRLKVEDFNTDSETLAVWQSKSGRPRHVVLTNDGAKFFRSITAGRTGSDHMFRKADASQWLPSHQAEPMRLANQRARLDPPANFHALRHTWASLSVMGGVPLLVVAKNMGHTDTRMVEKHYGHLADSFVKDAIRANAPRFGESAEGRVRPINGR